MSEGQVVIGDDLLLADEEEEILIYADFDTVLEDGIFQNNTFIKIIALESEEPFLQIGTQIYSGKWADTVGTYLFFEPELASPPVDPIFSDVSSKLLNYKFKTRKCLEVSRVFINQRCNSECTEELYSVQHNDTKENSKDVKNKVRKHYQKYIDQESQDFEMWLDFNGQPLKWHYPIGVLFDINRVDIQLPWNVTVHFNKFPEDEIIHCLTRDAVESYFMSCLKEADVLKHRSQIVSSMQKKDHIQLWLGLQNDKFDQFWAVNRKLMELGSGEETFKYIPFRVYQLSKDSSVIQQLIKPLTEQGNRKTLRCLLQELFPEETSTMQVTTHGVEPPWDTPLQWMSEHLSYPDNFLHLCVGYK